LQSLEQLAEEPLGCLGAAPALHQDVEHVSMLVHRSPKAVQLAPDAYEHLVHELLVARLGSALLSVLANSRPKRRPHSRMLSQLTTRLRAARMVSTLRRLRLKQ